MLHKTTFLDGVELLPDIGEQVSLAGLAAVLGLGLGRPVAHGGGGGGGHPAAALRATLGGTVLRGEKGRVLVR